MLHLSNLILPILAQFLDVLGKGGDGGGRGGRGGEGGALRLSPMSIKFGICTHAHQAGVSLVVGGGGQGGSAAPWLSARLGMRAGRPRSPIAGQQVYCFTPAADQNPGLSPQRTLGTARSNWISSSISSEVQWWSTTWTSGIA